MQLVAEDLRKIGLIFIICVTFFASVYCREAVGLPIFNGNPVIVKPYASDKPSTCTVVSSQYDGPPLRASTTTYTSSMINLTSSAQFGTVGTTTTV